MLKIDRDKFLFLYEQGEFGTLTEPAQAGLLDIISQLEADKAITDIRWAAYMLATVKRECGGEWKPIKEYDRGRGRPYGKPAGPYGLCYYGRGLTQNTWLDNYQMLTDAWNKEHPDRHVDFVKNPDLLLELEYSYWAMSYAMRHGSYTGVGLKKYIDGDKCDFLNARRIINGTDCAEKIAADAKKILDALEQAQIAEA